LQTWSKAAKMDSQRPIYDPLLDSYYGRNEEFFQTGAVRNSGTLHLQRVFNPVKNLNVYYFKKITTVNSTLQAISISLEIAVADKSRISSRGHCERPTLGNCESFVPRRHPVSESMQEPLPPGFSVLKQGANCAHGKRKYPYQADEDGQWLTQHQASSIIKHHTAAASF
jgi:hypothetical protein